MSPSPIEIAWTVVSVVVAIGIGLGYTAGGMTPPDSKFARICFWGSAMVLGGMDIVWSVTTDRSLTWRIVIGALIGATIFVLLPEGLRFVKRREESWLTVPPSPQHPTPPVAPAVARSIEAEPKIEPLLAPMVSPSYKVMPSDPPYAPNTIIGGVEFKPHTLDVRLYLGIKNAPIKNLNLKIKLINTSGQLLFIQKLGQVTTIPDVVIVPVLGGKKEISSVQVTQDEKTSTLPLGGTSPSVSLNEVTDTWLIRCNDLLVDSTPQFVLMVTKPLRTKMIEGFTLTGSYDYNVYGRVKTANLSNTIKFDDKGTPYAPTEQELDAIRKYRPSDVKVSNLHIYLNDTPTDSPSTNKDLKPKDPK
jgi:hypothetical protein